MCRRRFFKSYLYIEYGGRKYKNGETVSVSPFIAEGNSTTIGLDSARPWNITNNISWLTVSSSSNKSGTYTITLTASANQSYDGRSGSFTAKTLDDRYSIVVSVSQETAATEKYIRITPSPISMGAEDTYTALECYLHYNGTATKITPATWTSNNQAVTVGTNGVVQSNNMVASPLTATTTATYVHEGDTLTTTSEVRVAAAEIQRFIAVEPQSAIMGATGTQQLTVTYHEIINGHETMTNVTNTSDYSGNSQVITVNGTGLISANNQSEDQATATITVMYDSVPSVNVPVTANSASVEYRNLRVEPSEMSLGSSDVESGKLVHAYVDEYINGRPTGVVIEVTSAATWNSNHTDIATVSSTGNNEVIKPVYGSGYFPDERNATITGSYLGMTDTCEVTVEPEGYVQQYLTVQPSTTSITSTGGVQLVVKLITKTDGVITGEETVTNDASYDENSPLINVNSTGYVSATGSETGGTAIVTVSYPGVDDVQATINVQGASVTYENLRFKEVYGTTDHDKSSTSLSSAGTDWAYFAYEDVLLNGTKTGETNVSLSCSYTLMSGNTVIATFNGGTGTLYSGEDLVINYNAASGFIFTAQNEELVEKTYTLIAEDGSMEAEFEITIEAGVLTGSLSVMPDGTSTAYSATSATFVIYYTDLPANSVIEMENITYITGWSTQSFTISAGGSGSVTTTARFASNSGYSSREIRCRAVLKVNGAATDINDTGHYIQEARAAYIYISGSTEITARTSSSQQVNTYTLECFNIDTSTIGYGYTYQGNITSVSINNANTILTVGIDENTSTSSTVSSVMWVSGTSLVDGSSVFAYLTIIQAESSVYTGNITLDCSGARNYESASIVLDGVGVVEYSGNASKTGAFTYTSSTQSFELAMASALGDGARYKRYNVQIVKNSTTLLSTNCRQLYPASEDYADYTLTAEQLNGSVWYLTGPMETTLTIVPDVETIGADGGTVHFTVTWANMKEGTNLSFYKDGDISGIPSPYTNISSGGTYSFSATIGANQGENRDISVSVSGINIADANQSATAVIRQMTADSSLQWEIEERSINANTTVIDDIQCDWYHLMSGSSALTFTINGDASFNRSSSVKTLNVNLTKAQADDSAYTPTIYLSANTSELDKEIVITVSGKDILGNAISDVLTITQLMPDGYIYLTPNSYTVPATGGSFPVMVDWGHLRTGVSFFNGSVGVATDPSSEAGVTGDKTVYWYFNQNTGSSRQITLYGSGTAKNNVNIVSSVTITQTGGYSPDGPHLIREYPGNEEVSWEAIGRDCGTTLNFSFIAENCTAVTISWDNSLGIRQFGGLSGGTPAGSTIIDRETVHNGTTIETNDPDSCTISFSADVSAQVNPSTGSNFTGTLTLKGQDANGNTTSISYNFKYYA